MEIQTHLIIFLLPLQRPVNCMLKLAEILCVHDDTHVTFLNTEHLHRRLQSYTDIEERLHHYPNFQFETLPDRMPEDSPRIGEQIVEMVKSYFSHVEWTKGVGKIVINGTDYQLEQCHWHTPSENTVNGKRFDMELHLVHKNAHDELAAVSVLYNIGSPDPFLARLVSHIKTADKKGKDIGIIDPLEIGFGSMKYYRFIGSLTTPPCTEGVLWTVITQPKTVSQEQMNALKAAVDDGFQQNARPLQPLNGRIVYVNQP